MDSIDRLRARLTAHLVRMAPPRRLCLTVGSQSHVERVVVAFTAQVDSHLKNSRFNRVREKPLAVLRTRHED